MANETGKPFTQSDAEISEAIDFLEYYPLTFGDLNHQLDATLLPRGTGLVIGPWNFPLAIPCGGIVQSLITGNTTLLKPAPEAFHIAQALMACFRDAGICEDVLDLALCQEGPDLDALVQSKHINFILFTGSTTTAKTIL